MQEFSISVLDDDEFILEVTQALLQRMGMEDVRTFSSAAVALASMDMHDPNQLLLSDLNMPGMDGVEVIRYLGQRNYAGAVIVLSSEDARMLQTVTQIAHAHRLRILGALGKPIDQHALRALLEKFVVDVVPSKKNKHNSLTEEEIRVGLQEHALVPYFQPQVDVRSGKVVGVEALARWQHPQHGIIGPVAFIPVAEESELINTLTDRMISRSMREWRRWYDAGLELTLSINISMHSIDRVDFPDQLVTEALIYGVPLNKLILEITESHLAHDAMVSSDVLARLCLKRVCMSIDDFGTAYSNLEKLQMLPFGELKIDRAFVHGAGDNPLSSAILKSSVELGKRLGMKIVAEGVETQADWDCAAELGCDLIQGYYVAMPMASDELVRWVQEWHR